jgi:hypothetical protein
MAKREFSEVFPSAVIGHTTATPVASPLMGASAEPRTPNKLGSATGADATLERITLWSQATRALSLPDRSPFHWRSSVATSDKETAKCVASVCTEDMDGVNDRETLVSPHAMNYAHFKALLM